MEKNNFSLEFQNYLKQNGIIHNTSVAYCPQSNEKAERLNRTLVEKARCM
jgi:transposase InsO family protein